MSTWRTWLREPIPAEAEQGVHADRPLGQVVRKRIARTQTPTGGRWPVDPLRHSRRAGPRPSQGRQEAALPARVLRRACCRRLHGSGSCKRLKAFQDNLGEHQDAEVHIAVLRDISRELYAAGVASDTMVAIGQLSERLDQRRIAARVEFAERFADYDTKATKRALAAALDGLT